MEPMMLVWLRKPILELVFQEMRVTRLSVRLIMLLDNSRISRPSYYSTVEKHTEETPTWFATSSIRTYSKTCPLLCMASYLDSQARWFMRILWLSRSTLFIPPGRSYCTHVTTMNIPKRPCLITPSCIVRESETSISTSRSSPNGSCSLSSRAFCCSSWPFRPWGLRLMSLEEAAKHQTSGSWVHCCTEGSWLL